jgi:hypothetical protein
MSTQNCREETDEGEEKEQEKLACVRQLEGFAEALEVTTRQPITNRLPASPPQLAGWLAASRFSRLGTE